MTILCTTQTPRYYYCIRIHCKKIKQNGFSPYVLKDFYWEKYQMRKYETLLMCVITWWNSVCSCDADFWDFKNVNYHLMPARNYKITLWYLNVLFCFVLFFLFFHQSWFRFGTITAVTKTYRNSYFFHEQTLLCCTFDFVHFDFTLIKIRMASIMTRILRENCVLKILRFFMLIFTDWLQYSSMQMTPVHYLYLQIMNTITWNILFIWH